MVTTTGHFPATLKTLLFNKFTCRYPLSSIINQLVKHNYIYVCMYVLYKDRLHVGS
jgi:hypothetical protein